MFKILKSRLFFLFFVRLVTFFFFLRGGGELNLFFLQFWFCFEFFASKRYYFTKFCTAIEIFVTTLSINSGAPTQISKWHVPLEFPNGSTQLWPLFSGSAIHNPRSHFWQLLQGTFSQEEPQKKKAFVEKKKKRCYLIYTVTYYFIKRWCICFPFKIIFFLTKLIVYFSLDVYVGENKLKNKKRFRKQQKVWTF